MDIKPYFQILSPTKSAVPRALTIRIGCVYKFPYDDIAMALCLRTSFWKY